VGPTPTGARPPDGLTGRREDAPPTCHVEPDAVVHVTVVGGRSEGARVGTTWGPPWYEGGAEIRCLTRVQGEGRSGGGGGGGCHAGGDIGEGGQLPPTM
jgi:hypothetical protein